MKTVTVAYLHSNNYADPKFYQKRFLIETEQDIQEAKDSKVIGVLHLEGMRKLIARGERVILNKDGGYCGAHGTWAIIPDKETQLRAFDAMLKGKSFRLRATVKDDFNKGANYNFITSQWFTISAIHYNGKITVCGTNHEVLENIYLDSLIEV